MDQVQLKRAGQRAQTHRLLLVAHCLSMCVCVCLLGDAPGTTNNYRTALGLKRGLQGWKRTRLNPLPFSVRLACRAELANPDTHSPSRHCEGLSLLQPGRRTPPPLLWGRAEVTPKGTEYIRVKQAYLKPGTRGTAGRALAPSSFPLPAGHQQRQKASASLLSAELEQTLPSRNVPNAETAQINTHRDTSGSRAPAEELPLPMPHS